jgi:hypothetical protein
VSRAALAPPASAAWAAPEERAALVAQAAAEGQPQATLAPPGSPEGRVNPDLLEVPTAPAGPGVAEAQAARAARADNPDCIG